MILSGCMGVGGDAPLYSDDALFIGDQKIIVAIADTAEEHARGLSGRNELCDACGMLFVFDDTNIRHFWMKEMLFDIDVIWIADDRIVGTTERISHIEQERSVFVSPQPVDRVLELPAGYVARHGISIGQKIDYHEGGI